MKRFSFFPRSLFLSAFLVFILTGCAAQNVVPLTYPTTVNNTPWCRWDLTVAAFEDLRTTPAVLGTLDEQVNYVPGSSVAEWTTRAMYEEMKGRGCECRYTSTPDKVSGFLISGQVLEIHLDKVGLSTWKTQMKIRYTLTRNGEQLYSATHTGEVEKPIVLDRDATSLIMAEGLQDITTQAVEAMIPAMEKVQVF
ncbi:MAG: hypothetical protein AB7E32_10885 [Desulfovibrio sp.]